MDIEVSGEQVGYVHACTYVCDCSSAVPILARACVRAHVRMCVRVCLLHDACVYSTYIVCSTLCLLQFYTQGLIVTARNYLDVYPYEQWNAKVWLHSAN